MAHTVCRGTGKPGQAPGREAVARSLGFLYFCFLMNRNTQHSLLLPVVLHVKTECWVSQIAHIVSVVQITDNLHPDILGGIIQEIPANCARDEWNSKASKPRNVGAGKGNLFWKMNLRIFATPMYCLVLSWSLSSIHKGYECGTFYVGSYFSIPAFLWNVFSL